MDARKCLEIAKGWLEQAEEADDQEDAARYLDLGKRWLEVGGRLESLEAMVNWGKKDHVDGPAEGEDG